MACLFCKFINDKDILIYEDDDIAVFKDQYPKSRFHLLAIPKKHIKDIGKLTADDIDLGIGYIIPYYFDIVEHMKDVGLKLLEENGADMTKTKLGFHDPLFTSIKHLHLHCLGLPYVNCWKHMQCIRLWFTDVDKLIAKLKKKGSNQR